MKRLLVAIVALVLLGGGSFLLYQRHTSPRANRDRLVERFIAVLPDSLDNNHIAEIRKLFYMLYERERLGKVKPETSKFITEELASYVKKGHITASQLNHFMAEVGYSTYKDDKKYTLPDGSNDNPVLNPKSAMVSLRDTTQYDSAFVAGYKKWEKEHPALIDSLKAAADSLPDGPSPRR